MVITPGAKFYRPGNDLHEQSADEYTNCTVLSTATEMEGYALVLLSSGQVFEVTHGFLITLRRYAFYSRRWEAAERDDA